MTQNGFLLEYVDPGAYNQRGEKQLNCIPIDCWCRRRNTL